MQIWEHFYPYHHVLVLKLSDATRVPAPGTVYKYLLNIIGVSPLCFHLDTKRLSSDAKLKPDTQTIWKVTIIRKGSFSHLSGTFSTSPMPPTFKIVPTLKWALCRHRHSPMTKAENTGVESLWICPHAVHLWETCRWVICNDSTFLGRGEWEGRNTQLLNDDVLPD